mmetsp:Transcript_36597/g.105223  ORF Transcript_36597/g.105223 Transcript_36597/m.105223 type:complete len:346 (-) Transcript_36597:1314-2351(-)
MQALDANLCALLEHKVVALLGVKVMPWQLMRRVALDGPHQVCAACHNIEQVVRASALDEYNARILIGLDVGNGVLRAEVAQQLCARRQLARRDLHILDGGQRRQLVNHLAQPIRDHRLSLNRCTVWIGSHGPHRGLRRCGAPQNLVLDPFHGLLYPARVQPRRVCNGLRLDHILQCQVQAPHHAAEANPDPWLSNAAPGRKVRQRMHTRCINSGHRLKVNDHIAGRQISLEVLFHFLNNSCCRSKKYVAGTPEDNPLRPMLRQQLTVFLGPLLQRTNLCKGGLVDDPSDAGVLDDEEAHGQERAEDQSGQDIVVGHQRCHDHSAPLDRGDPLPRFKQRCRDEVHA